jgi:hypothetical protein
MGAEVLPFCDPNLQSSKNGVVAVRVSAYKR